MPPAAALTAAVPGCLLTVCLSLDTARGWEGEGDVDGSHSARPSPAVSPCRESIPCSIPSTKGTPATSCSMKRPHPLAGHSQLHLGSNCGAHLLN